MKSITTISIKPKNIIKLEDFATQTGLEKSRLISILLRKSMRRMIKQINSSMRTQYQSPDPEMDILHITISDLDWERAADMRRFFKMSVSFIIGYAIENFLHEILKELIQTPSNSVDNYLSDYRVFVRKEKDFVVFMPIWGKMRL